MKQPVEGIFIASKLHTGLWSLSHIMKIQRHKWKGTETIEKLKT